MAIIAVRVDGRLIHGQVANLWTTSLGATRIMVIDDRVSESDIEKTALRMATPTGIKLSVLSIDKAANNILAKRYDSQKVFIVAKTPDVLLKLIEKGVPITEVNIGNMSQTSETKHINKSINVTASDVEVFKILAEKGIKMTNRMVPGDKENNFMDLIKEL